MEIIVLASFVSFLVAFISIPVVIKIADAKKLFDHPGERKIHFTPVPSLGGVGIFAALIFSIATFIDFNKAHEIQFFISAAVIIFFLGLKDDILLISPVKKFAGQLIAAFLLSFQGDFQLNSLHGFMGIHELHPAIATIFTYLTLLVVINAYNLIDGVDGLAGMLGLISTLFFGIVFTLENQTAYAILSFAMSGSLIAFLMYNISPSRIFMGDTGSLLLGLVNAVLVIKFINLESGSGTVLHFSAAPAVGFSVLFVPLMDTLRVTLVRIYNGKSPFDPDVNHLHHLLLKRGFSHIQITGILTVVALLFIIVALVLQPMGITLVILSLFFLAVVMVTMLIWAGKAELHSLDRQQSNKSATSLVKNIFSKVSASDSEINN